MLKKESSMKHMKQCSFLAGFSCKALDVLLDSEQRLPLSGRHSFSDFQADSAMSHLFDRIQQCSWQRRPFNQRRFPFWLPTLCSWRTANKEKLQDRDTLQREHASFNSRTIPALIWVKQLGILVAQNYWAPNTLQEWTVGRPKFIL